MSCVRRWVHPDTQLLSQLPNERLPRILAVADVAAGKVPHIGIPTPLRPAMTKKDPVPGPK